MTKQLVTLIGAVASVGILVAGALLFALPQFTGSQQINADAASVEQANAVQQAALDALSVQAADMTELDREVAELRRQIPASVRADDIVQLAADAAAAHGGTVVAIAVGETSAFAPRTGEVDPAASTATETSTATAESPGTDAAEPSAAPADPAAAPADPSAAPAAEDGPQQVSITLSVATPDRRSATAIIDELRDGPRLVAITNAGITTDDEGVVTAEVTLLAFHTGE